MCCESIMGSIEWVIMGKLVLGAGETLIPACNYTYRNTGNRAEAGEWLCAPLTHAQLAAGEGLLGRGILCVCVLFCF